MDYRYVIFQLVLLIVFAALVGVRILYMRWVKGINALSIIKNKGKQKALGITVVSLINLWVAVLLIYILHPEIEFLPQQLATILIRHNASIIVGIVIILLGLVIYILSWVSLRNTWRIGHDEKNQSNLVVNGIYGISRHPMYLFYAMYFIGTFFINRASVFLVFAIAQSMTLHFLIIEEEKSLADTYGESFINYKKNTKRYWTFKKA